MIEQYDLFPLTFSDLQHSLAQMREDHKKVHRALWREIEELRKENALLVAEIRGINESLLYENLLPQPIYAIN